ncbi:MAG: nucleoside transporter C-terminal domain-containing protein [Lachnospiraceae bacterium]|nr:nucleoside transporter C-terminal domain-containing protein [Lachnospiraceae bacterium]
MRLILNVLGIFVILLLMWLLSYKKKDVNVKIIVKGIIVELIVAFILVKIPAGRTVISVMSDGVSKVLSYANDGIEFVFGSLSDPTAPTGSIMAIQTFAVIIFVSALFNVLYYVGILSVVIKYVGKFVGKIMGTSQVETFVAAANMFLGQSDSPILISKYLNRMTDSEIMVVLVSGMGSMSANVLGGYMGLGIPMEYLLVASVMVPFGSILISKIILPQTEEVTEVSDIKIDNKAGNANVLAALTEGGATGLQVAVSIAATIMVMISTVALINGILGVFGLSLQQILGTVFAPLGALLGLEGEYITEAGKLLGSKLVLNEFVAFADLGAIIKSMDYRTGLVMTVALSGFANVGSMGICVSAIGALCPEKKSVLARLAPRAMLGGFGVSVLSAMIVGVITLF